MFLQRKNVFLMAFMLNASAFGLANIVDIFTKQHELVKYYPLLPFAIWSAVISYFGFRGWKPLFYCNVIPLLLVMMVSIFDHGPGGSNVSSTVQAVLIPTGLLVGFLWQGVILLRWWKSKIRHRRIGREQASLVDSHGHEEDLESKIEGTPTDIRTFKGLIAAAINPDDYVDESMVMKHWEYQAFCDYEDIVAAVEAADHFYAKQGKSRIETMMSRLPLVLRKRGTPINYCRIRFSGIEDPHLGVKEYITRILECHPDPESLEVMQRGLGALECFIERVEMQPEKKAPLYSII